MRMPMTGTSVCLRLNQGLMHLMNQARLVPIDGLAATVRVQKPHVKHGAAVSCLLSSLLFVSQAEHGPMYFKSYSCTDTLAKMR